MIERPKSLPANWFDNKSISDLFAEGVGSSTIDGRRELLEYILNLTTQVLRAMTDRDISDITSGHTYPILCAMLEERNDLMVN